jgi:release factor glutamine methyltransferase
MSPRLTIRQALEQANAAANPEHASQLTLEVLLASALSRDRAWLYAHDRDTLNPDIAEQFRLLARRASDGEPLAYLTGNREFYGLHFNVTPDVLIPRPETEMLVDLALRWVEEQKCVDPRIVDVGTGSGALAVTLAVKLAKAQIWAVDTSPDALAVAHQNAALHEVENRIRWVEGDLLEDLAEPFDLIIANLPYIPSGTLETLEVSRWEPRMALDGGPDGLNLIRQLVDQMSSRMADRGLLALEIQFDQAEAVSTLIHEIIPSARVTVYRDLSGHERVVTAQQP